MDYGKKIAHLRKSKGLTQEELGKVLNVTYQAVSKWERGESLPDFATMSQIARYFQVPLEYFDSDDDTLTEAAFAEPAADGHILGMCTVCGKMLKEGEEHTTSPKIVCKECAERQQQESLRMAQAAEQTRTIQKEREIKNQLGGGFDAKLIVSIVLAFLAYVGLTVSVFLCNSDDAFLYAALLFVVPLAVYACTHAVFDLINDLRDRDDGPEGYTRNLSLILGAAFAVVNIALFLVIYFTVEQNFYFILTMILGAVLSFTFVSQYTWGSVVREMFTCGGFTFKMPGFIFSLSLDSILLMIVLKLVLGIVSILVFLITTVFFALIAIFGSVFTFIPCVIYKSVKDKKARA